MKHRKITIVFGMSDESSLSDMDLAKRLTREMKERYFLDALATVMVDSTDCTRTDFVTGCIASAEYAGLIPDNPLDTSRT